MSAWRREALVALPEFKQLIAASESPMALWIDLHVEFNRAFEANDASRVRRVMEYAKWCWDGRDSDTVNAAAFERLRPMLAYHARNEAVAEKLNRNPSRRSHS